MTGPPNQGRGDEPRPSAPWHQRRPTSDDHTRIARAQANPPRRYPPPAYRRPPADHRPPSPPDIPWYLQRPDRPPPPPPAAEPKKTTAETKDAEPADRRSIRPWLLLGAGGLVLAMGIAVLIGSVPKLGATGGAVLDVDKVQTGVLQTLSDPASGYGANIVTDVSCNGGRNPGADKGTTFSCDATVNGSQRHVTVVVSDDNGTYEVDGPR